MSRKELKQAAKDQLRGNWTWAVLVSFIAGLITYLINDIISLIFNGQDIVYKQVSNIVNGVDYVVASQESAAGEIVQLIATVIIGLILWGVAFTILKFRDTGKKDDIIKGIFSAYTNGRFTTAFVTYLVEVIFLALWTCLLIIPGIIKGFSYAMTPYIMKDMYDAGKKPAATEAITASRKLMDGHKTDLFVLWLSFIGWAILGTITCGIGFLWITPYYRQTMANFYRNLAGDQFLKEK
ncbi:MULTISPECIES: DUF975 family protein [Lactobacillus]|uniref:DUF975 family protein n=1 Tax=Lactobacillus xujianguonis TaxID=2495899 RepID=A0A437SWY6_9LACO|nr:MULTISPECIES: DUF975 family protein [Lactobacillus]RVU71433.1 DUF975 family protein [Lactobacillus xujianguonis]RVU72454.1 DUF975 family protein [Lactobacillus xujianguonis]